MKEKAKQFATKAHHGQTRKNGNAPYITHPIRVAEHLESIGCPEDLVAAAYLHDVVEDTIYELEDIKQEFGQEVIRIVAAHTEDKSKPWKERKQHTIETVRDGDTAIKYLIVADKLDNLLGLEKELQEYGEQVWDNFNAPKDQQAWYNRSIAENMYKGLPKKETPNFFQTYETTIKRVFG